MKGLHIIYISVVVMSISFGMLTKSFAGGFLFFGVGLAIIGVIAAIKEIGE